MACIHIACIDGCHVQTLRLVWCRVGWCISQWREVCHFLILNNVYHVYNTTVMHVCWKTGFGFRVYVRRGHRNNLSLKKMDPKPEQAPSKEDATPFGEFMYILIIRQYLCIYSCRNSTFTLSSSGLSGFE